MSIYLASSLNNSTLVNKPHTYFFALKKKDHFGQVKNLSQG